MYDPLPRIPRKGCDHIIRCRTRTIKLLGMCWLNEGKGGGQRSFGTGLRASCLCPLHNTAMHTTLITLAEIRRHHAKHSDFSIINQSQTTHIMSPITLWLALLCTSYTWMGYIAHTFACHIPQVGYSMIFSVDVPQRRNPVDPDPEVWHVIGANEEPVRKSSIERK